MNAVDLFAGPGGWDLGAQALGLDPLGIEFDDAACATRKAAGLRTVQGDVSALDPADYPCELLIASPPCQAWSMAGKREGLKDQARVFDLATRWAADPTDERGGEWFDERSPLAAEPIRWASTLRPRLMAWEQVPPVIDLWRHCAGLLRELGYHVWTGILSAERYGVPQTRKRAILLASLDRPVHPPLPTHQEYRSGEPAWDGPMLSLEGELLPWVSMAEALGWTGRVGFPRQADDGAATEDGYRERDFRDTDEPAFNLTEKARSWTLRNNTSENAAERQGDEPAPTLYFGARMNGVTFRANAQANAAERDASEPAPTIKGGNDSGDRVWLDRRQGGAPPRSQDEPAHTQSSSGLATGRDVWIGARPAPTIVGTRRSDQGMIVGRQLPEGEGRNVGGHNWHERPATTIMPGVNRSSTELPNGAGKDAVRVSVEEASILQSFPPDYPWQGSRSKQFQQIGNAVPPLLARAVLSALLEAQEARKAA